MAPFFVAGLVVMYGINSLAGALAQSTFATTSKHSAEKGIENDTHSSRIAEQFKNDPRNPNAKTQKPGDKH
ncbi:MAG: hypothetical protein Q9175_000542 [Cornicularia normoerica]